MSLIKRIKELGRQIKTGDSNYYRKFLFFFELEVPFRLAPGPSNRFAFPLVLSPESYSLSEPFSVEVAMTAGAGLYVEENGIIQRSIRLEGHTGFKPRDLRNQQPTGLLLRLPNGRSYTRTLPSSVLADISGHRHFMYLQDAVFRTYADLKRDPATAADTKLYFHIPKDEEHWRVVPQKFDLIRTKDKRTLYQYSIDLLVTEKADESLQTFSEDQNLLDKMRNLIRMVKDAVSMISGAINDLTALVGEIVQFVKDIISIIDTVRDVLDAVDNFLNGVTNLIQVPYTAVESVIAVIETNLAIVEAAEDIGTVARTFPQNVEQRMRQLQQGLEMLGTNPAAFETALGRQMREIKNLQSTSTSVSQETIDTALNTPPPSTFEAVNQVGTGLTQGDAIAANVQPPPGRGIQAYTSATQVSIAQGDTLVNLAARYLGDARLWQHIATMNGLKPPFTLDEANAPLGTENSGLSQSLTRGSKLLTPNYDVPPSKLPVLPVLGVKSEEPAEVHILGTDFAMDPVAGRVGSELFDFVVDVEGGSQDFKKVRGVNCLAQGLRTRAITERGHDTLYKQLGMVRVIGLGNTVVDAETVRFRAIETLNQDARVAAVRRLEIVSEADRVTIDSDVEIRGFADTQSIALEL